MQKAVHKNMETNKIIINKKHDHSWRKCGHCGKFISYKQLNEKKEVSFKFTPDTEFSSEEGYWIHNKCNIVDYDNN